MGMASSVFAAAVEAMSRSAAEGAGTLRAAIGTLVRYPIKAVALFLTAPFLAFRVAMIAKNPVRRLIAGAGLFLATLLAWFAGTFLGTVVGALFVASNVSILVGIGFLVGTTLSVVLSGAFCLVAFNATCWLFLHISSEDVIDYLNSKSSA